MLKKATLKKHVRVVLKIFALPMFLVAILTSGSASAQLGGHHILGDSGLQSASQPPPGFYVSGMFHNYHTSEIKNRFGDPLPGEGTLNLGFFVPAVSVVTPIKILGANYGFLVSFPFSATRLELPRLDVEDSLSGYTDMYLRPIELGWHPKAADILLGYGFYAPTGRFEPGADDNTGLGMWSHELLAGATVYFDEAKKWHLSGTGFYETHARNKDLDTKVGGIFTVEGGLGRTLFGGLGNLGIAYYGQWKVTDDEISNLPDLITLGKNRVQGVGPEIGAPIPLGTDGVLLLGFRYLWEFDARSNTQGQTLNFTVTLPLAQFQ